MRKVEVRLDWGTEAVHVGTLAEEGRRIYFEYEDEFLEDPLPISPFMLPPRPGLFEEKDGVFDGLFGVFNDSLPDGWGLLLMDREFRRRGLDQLREAVTRWREFAEAVGVPGHISKEIWEKMAAV